MRQIIKKVIREVLNEGVLSFKKRKITKVFHVGEMNIKNKSKFSLEGSGLSVSINPNEWRKIAKLGDKELHILTNPNGIFVDGNKLNKQQKNNVISWGVENGYISQKETYKVCWYDDEMEDDVCMEFTTYDEAKVEAEYGRTIEVNKGGLLPTSKLISTSMQGRIEPSQTFDLLLTIFVEKTTNYDGIWWNDKLDVMKYSAPRGVIFNSKLNNWKIRLPEIAGGFLNEGNRDEYKELEFVCHNTDYSDSTSKEDQVEFYRDLKKLEIESDYKIHPYSQDFCDDNHDEISLAVIILDKKNSKYWESKIKKLSKKHGIEFDLYNYRNDREVDSIIRGTGLYTNLIEL